MQSNRLITILDAVVADGEGNPQQVDDFDFVGLQLSSASNANMVVKIQGSLSDDVPDFGAAQSVTNHWDYVDVIDLEDGASIDGDTGITLSGTDDFRNLELNVTGMKWINAIVSSWSAGALTLKAKLIKRD